MAISNYHYQNKVKTTAKIKFPKQEEGIFFVFLVYFFFNFRGGEHFFCLLKNPP
jgi:hypothetical protein